MHIYVSSHAFLFFDLMNVSGTQESKCSYRKENAYLSVLIKTAELLHCHRLLLLEHIRNTSKGQASERANQGPDSDVINKN